jgi:hypothetical protein
MRNVLRWQLALLVAVIAAIGMTAAFVYSINSGGSSSSAVKACYDPGTGQLRAVDAVASCTRSESPIDWTQVKAQGAVVLSGGYTIPVHMSRPGPVGP